MTILIDGKPVRDKILLSLKDEIEILTEKKGRSPGLAVILVGEDPASSIYVKSKHKTCLNIGINSFQHQLPADAGEAALKSLILSLNADETVDGILLQVPLPKGYNEDELLGLISHEKDVDGFHPYNVGRLLLGNPTFQSCTPYGVCQLLDAYNIETEGKHVVIVGRSNIVGKPLAAMLVQKASPGNSTVTICHSRSKNMSELTKQADILVAAIGQPEFITSEMVKDDVVVIDVGINRLNDATAPKGYRVVGDVHFESVSKKASAITPVPGGVGVMTIAMLMKNTIESFKQKI
jgi:methylenetetrahydrofolate dehydrogenase (NADP+) / methenyltetrahydrofolate cyclohydrolase